MAIVNLYNQAGEFACSVEGAKSILSAEHFNFYYLNGRYTKVARLKISAAKGTEPVTLAILPCYRGDSSIWKKGIRLQRILRDNVVNGLNLYCHEWDRLDNADRDDMKEIFMEVQNSPPSSVYYQKKVPSESTTSAV